MIARRALALSAGGCAVDATTTAGVEATAETSAALTVSELWSTLSGQREGWAKDVIGGKNGSLYTVTNRNDDGAGSLREALESDDPITSSSGPAWTALSSSTRPSRS